MQRRTIMIGIVGAGALAAGVANSGWRSGDVEFTRPALPAPARIDLRGDLSTVYVGVPMDLEGAARQAEALLPAKPVAIADWIANGACAKRTQWVECTSAKLEGTVMRSGPVALEVEATGATLHIPLKYDLGVHGIGFTRHLTERKAGEHILSVPFDIVYNATGTLEVGPRAAKSGGDGDITLLKGTVRLDRILEARLKPAVKAAEETLRATLARLPVRAAVNNAWSMLARPFELSAGSGLWLYALPEHYGSGGLAVIDGKAVFRTAITARLTVSDAEQAASVAQKRSQPVLSQAPLPPGPTKVRMATAIDLEAMRQAADAVLITAEPMESRADRFTEPARVKVRSTRVYPAQRQIGLELDLDAATPRGTTWTGKAHLVGRPVLDPAAGTIGVADVSFPPVSAKEQHQSRYAGQPRIGAEPFAARFAAAARLDIMQPLKEALPRATHLLNQRLEKDLTLIARLGEAVPVSLELAKDGAYLLMDLTGELTFVYTGAPQPATPVAATAEAPATDAATSGPVSTIATTAAAAAGAAVAAKAVKTRRPAGSIAKSTVGQKARQRDAIAARQRPFRATTVFPANPT